MYKEVKGGRNMYRRILVPLDGSELAESALTHAEDIAKSCRTEEVILVRVTEPIRGRGGHPQALGPTEPAAQTLMTGDINPYSETHVAPPTDSIVEAPVLIGRDEKQIQEYLNGVAKEVTKRLRSKSIKVRTEVLIGNPAEEITSFVENDGADLIVMASHGRSGLSKWASGSIAERIFRASQVPVLTIKMTGTASII